MTLSAPTTIRVAGDPSYDVVVGDGVVESALGPLLDGVTRLAVVTSDSLQMLAKPALVAAESVGVEATLLCIPDGEAAKDISVVELLWTEFGRLNLTRSDAVVAVGGGAVSDVAGFAAASWLRGVRWVAAPTSLLAMVDAAVGGKTGVNTAAGKNLVGAFHPPFGVLVDLGLLASLPQSEWINGLAEVVKAGFIADPAILELIERDNDEAVSPTGAVARELIERSIAVKARVVGADLREAGLREVLNYGHTLGHAIERAEHFRRRHGHAVSIGMIFVAALARRAGRLDDATAARHRRVLAAVGLPIAYDGSATWPELLEGMAHDKKARGSTLRFVVLDGLAAPGILSAPDQHLLAAAWSDVVA